VLVDGKWVKESKRSPPKVKFASKAGRDHRAGGQGALASAQQQATAAAAKAADEKADSVAALERQLGELKKRQPWRSTVSCETAPISHTTQTWPRKSASAKSADYRQQSLDQARSASKIIHATAQFKSTIFCR
jgi:hypothetical protein